MTNKLKPTLTNEELDLILEKLEAYGCEEGDDTYKLLIKLSDFEGSLYAIPEGYQLVKSNPSGFTEELRIRRLFVHFCGSDVSGDNLGLEFYKAMLAAAKEQSK